MSGALVAVVGPGRDVPADLLADAEQLGGALANAGVTIVCGGLGGVMDAAARGGHDAGGTVIGVLPGDALTAANPWVTVAVATGMGEARNLVIVRTAHVVVAVGGGYGTLSEIAFALKLGRPVIGYRTWQLSRDGAVDPGIRVVETVEAAVEQTLAAVRDAGGGRHDPLKSKTAGGEDSA